MLASDLATLQHLALDLRPANQAQFGKFKKRRVEQLAPNIICLTVFLICFLHLGPYLAIPGLQAWSTFGLGM